MSALANPYPFMVAQVIASCCLALSRPVMQSLSVSNALLWSMFGHFAVCRYRHLTLADFSDSNPTLPPEELRAVPADARDQNAGPGFGFLIGGDAAGVQRAEGALEAQAAGAAARPDLAGRNPLMVFAEALLPWNDFGGQGLGEGYVLEQVDPAQNNAGPTQDRNEEENPEEMEMEQQ